MYVCELSTLSGEDQYEVLRDVGMGAHYIGTPGQSGFHVLNQSGTPCRPIAHLLTWWFQGGPRRMKTTCALHIGRRSSVERI